jgi:uncharacterized protein
MPAILTREAGFPARSVRCILPAVEPAVEQSAPGAPPSGTKSAVAFYGVVLALFLPAMLAQLASPVAGLAATQLFVFLLPALVATAGSNLKLVPYLRLGRSPPVLVLLGALAGSAGYLVAGSIMAATQRILPQGWVQAYDLTRLFEGPAWEKITLALLAGALAPACEEITFRGYLQTTLTLRRGPRAAIATGALLFAALHLDPVRFPALLVLGALFGWLTWRAGSVWPAVAAHAANNGLAAGLLLAAGVPEPPPAPSLGAIVSLFTLGAGVLAALLLAFRAAAPPPDPAFPSALALRDPASRSIAFHPGRVPRGLGAAAMLGVGAVLALAAAGIVRALSRGP